MQIQSPGQEDLLKEEMATHSSILTWRIPQTEEPCRLQSMRSQTVGHNRMIKQQHFSLWVKSKMEENNINSFCKEYINTISFRKKGNRY